MNTKLLGEVREVIRREVRGTYKTEPSGERPSESLNIVLSFGERKGEHDRRGGAVSMIESAGERWMHGVSVVYQADPNDATRNLQNGGHGR